MLCPSTQPAPSKAHILPSPQGRILKASCYPEVGRRWVFCFTYNFRDFEIRIDVEQQQQLKCENCLKRKPLFSRGLFRSEVQQSPPRFVRCFHFNGTGLQFLMENSSFPRFFFSIYIRANVITCTEKRECVLVDLLHSGQSFRVMQNRFKALSNRHRRVLHHNYYSASPKVPVRIRTLIK